MIRELRELPDFIPSLSSPIKGVEDPMALLSCMRKCFEHQKDIKTLSSNLNQSIETKEAY